MQRATRRRCRSKVLLIFACTPDAELHSSGLSEPMERITCMKNSGQLLIDAAATRSEDRTSIARRLAHVAVKEAEAFLDHIDSRLMAIDHSDAVANAFDEAVANELERLAHLYRSLR